MCGNICAATNSVVWSGIATMPLSPLARKDGTSSSRTQTGSDQSGIETGHVSMFRRIGITIDFHVSAGLLDEAIDLRKAETGPSPHFLSCEEWVECLDCRLSRHANAGIADKYPDILPR